MGSLDFDHDHGTVPRRRRVRELERMVLGEEAAAQDGGCLRVREIAPLDNAAEPDQQLVGQHAPMMTPRP